MITSYFAVNGVNDIIQGCAEPLPTDLVFIQSDLPLNEQVALLFDNAYLVENDIKVDPKEYQNNPDMIFTPDQAMLIICLGLADAIKDEDRAIEDMKNLPEWKGKTLGRDFTMAKAKKIQTFETHMDNVMGWLLNNAPANYAGFWLRITLAIYRVMFNHEETPNWDAFSDKIKDCLIVA